LLPFFGIPAIKPAKTGRKLTFPKMKKPARTASYEPFKRFENSLSGEGGEGTLSLSVFIIKVLGSAVWVGAPNFPPHDLAMFAIKFT
jgi:hypothetical protein